MTAPQAPCAGDDCLLELEAVYLSPSGQRCRLAARPYMGRAILVYDLPDGSPALRKWNPGFFLTRANWHLLRRIDA